MAISTGAIIAIIIVIVIIIILLVVFSRQKYDEDKTFYLIGGPEKHYEYNYTRPST